MAIPDCRAMIESDWQYVDLTVTAVVIQPNTWTTFTVANAIRFNRSYDWASVGEGQLPGGVVTFGLWVDQCDERPKLSARLTSGGVNYRVAAVEDVAANTRYDVACVPEVVKANA